MRLPRVIAAVLLSGFVLSLLVGALPGTSAAQTRLKVVATVAPIANLVRNVGGNRIDLTQLIPDGTDSHTFEPRPSDTRAIAEADLVVLNGIGLETPTQRLVAANTKPGAQVLLLADNTITRDEWIFDFSFPESRGNPNPHLWLDVAYAAKYADLVRVKLVEMDPANADYYEAHGAQLQERLQQLDQAIFAVTQTIPPQNRRLLTYHDSWAYFARRYGWEVVGAIQPSDFSEPRPRDVAQIIDQIRRSGLPAIFGSDVFPSRVLDAIGRETGARYVDTLRDDELPGDRNSPDHSYVALMLANIRTMASALGGDPSPAANVDPNNVAP
jgi:ABC-type Zn uptake system ZnuABC Zn-binding protein ZnuA